MTPPPTATVHGSCLCGAVHFDVRMPSRFCAHCHCSSCRRAHGAAFVTWAGFPEGQFRLLEGGAVLTRALTDTGATRSFCSRCGSTLLYQSPRWAGEVHVALANLDEPIDREPEAHCYVDHRAAWCRIEGSLPHYGGPDGMTLKEVESGATEAPSRDREPSA